MEIPWLFVGEMEDGELEKFFQRYWMSQWNEDMTCDARGVRTGRLVISG